MSEGPLKDDRKSRKNRAKTELRNSGIDPEVTTRTTSRSIPTPMETSFTMRNRPEMQARITVRSQMALENTLTELRNSFRQPASEDFYKEFYALDNDKTFSNLDTCIDSAVEQNGEMFSITNLIRGRNRPPSKTPRIPSGVVLPTPTNGKT